MAARCVTEAFSTTVTAHIMLVVARYIGVPDAFDGPHLINTFYLDGVSVTHGSPRQHIWSFVTGLDEGRDFSQSTCPCVAESTNDNTTPSFVGQNYFCESGITE